MIKVTANGESKRLNVGIKELGRIAEPGETFVVSEERFTVLTGLNSKKTCFVYRSPEVQPGPEPIPVPDDVEVEIINGAAYFRPKKEEPDINVTDVEVIEKPKKPKKSAE